MKIHIHFIKLLIIIHIFKALTTEHAIEVLLTYKDAGLHSYSVFGRFKKRNPHQKKHNTNNASKACNICMVVLFQ